MWRKKKFLIGGVLVLLAIGILVYNAFASGSPYYSTVSEFLFTLDSKASASGDSLYNERVRVNGEVVAGSIQEDWDGGERVVRFVITDNQNTLPVEYSGSTPDTFKDGAEVVLEGTYNPSGFFAATKLMAKCPSRFTPAQG